MTNISREEVGRLARLSNIELSDSETERLQTELANILGYVQQLSGLDTENTPPTYQVTDDNHARRADEVIDYGVSTADLLANAPETQDQQIKVPKVL
ncbi:MAG TPA: Asp-tRNA(Asn)/Glu-tRNA(Gln) amidotransferase subunit GatC [Candidatus Saccharimonadales bacterium]